MFVIGLIEGVGFSWISEFGERVVFFLLSVEFFGVIIFY